VRDDLRDNVVAADRTSSDGLGPPAATLSPSHAYQVRLTRRRSTCRRRSARPAGGGAPYPTVLVRPAPADQAHHTLDPVSQSPHPVLGSTQVVRSWPQPGGGVPLDPSVSHGVPDVSRLRPVPGRLSKAWAEIDQRIMRDAPRAADPGRGLVKRPASRLLSLQPDDSTTATASAPGRRRWRRAVGFRCARVSIQTVAVRVGGDKIPVDAEE
jgi:hypothetical protein